MALDQVYVHQARQIDRERDQRECKGLHLVDVRADAIAWKHRDQQSSL